MPQGHEHYHKHKHKHSQEPHKEPNHQPDVLGKADVAARNGSRDQTSNHQMKQAVASLREALASKDLDAVNVAAARIAAVAQLVKQQQQQDGVQLDQQQAGWQPQEQQGPHKAQVQQQQQQSEREQHWQQLQANQLQQQQQQQQYYSDGRTSQQDPHRSMRPSRLAEPEQQWACAGPAAAVQTPDWDLEEAPKYEDRYAWPCL